MTLSEKTPKKVTKKSTEVAEGWELFNPGDFYETKDLGIFNYFLNSKGTTDIMVANMDTSKFALIIRGEVEKDQKATVLYEDRLTNIKHSDRVDMVTALYFLPGVGNITKNRMGAVLGSYFNVEPKQ